MQKVNPILYERLKKIDQLPVYRDRIRIGTLTRTPHPSDTTKNVVRFVPGLDKDGNQIDAGIYNPNSLNPVWDNHLPNYFSNLLPEGQRMQRIEEILGISEHLDDEFSVLAALGADSIGNICVIKPINGPDAYVQISRDLDNSPMIELDGTRSLEELIAQELNFQPGVALSGGQEKLSAYTGATHIRVHSLGSETTERDAHYIVKTENPNYPNLIENERFFMDLAQDCGLEVPRILNVRVPDGSQLLLIERFDRVTSQDADEERRTRKVHTEDGAQILSIPSNDKYRVSWEEVSKKVLEVVDPQARSQSAETLFRLYCYSYMIGNGDLHAKNISVWDNPETGVTEITPCYDLVSTIYYKGKLHSQDKNMALSLEGTKDNIGPKKFRVYAEKIGIDKSRADEIMGEIARAVDKKISLFKPTDINPNMVNFAESTLNKRREPFLQLGLEQGRTLS